MDRVFVYKKPGPQGFAQAIDGLGLSRKRPLEKFSYPIGNLFSKLSRTPNERGRTARGQTIFKGFPAVLSGMQRDEPDERD